MADDGLSCAASGRSRHRADRPALEPVCRRLGRSAVCAVSRAGWNRPGRAARFVDCGVAAVGCRGAVRGLALQANKLPARMARGFRCRSRLRVHGQAARGAHTSAALPACDVETSRSAASCVSRLFAAAAGNAGRPPALVGAACLCRAAADDAALPRQAWDGHRAAASRAQHDSLCRQTVAAGFAAAGGCRMGLASRSPG